MILEHAKDANLHIQTLAGWTVLHLHKRVLSSPEALRRSLDNRRDALEKRLAGLSEPDAGLSTERRRSSIVDGRNWTANSPFVVCGLDFQEEGGSHEFNPS